MSIAYIMEQMFTFVSRGGRALSAKSKIMNILGIVACLQSLLPLLRSCFRANTATDIMQINGHGCVPIKLYLQNG